MIDKRIGRDSDRCRESEKVSVSLIVRDNDLPRKRVEER